MKIGDVLRRNDGTRWRLVGVQRTTGEWIAESADAFGSPVTLSAADLTDRFGGAVGPAEAPDDQEGWNRLAESYATVAIAKPGPSPEQQFAAVAAAAEPKPKARRR
jgi:hypothetical protein